MTDPISVLLAEDDPVQRFLLSLLAERSGGVALLTASDAPEALELSLRERPEVILLDLSLPGGALDFLRRYRRAGGRAGVIALSGCSGERVRAGVLAAGADVFLPKPVPWRELWSYIRLLSGGLTRRCEELLSALGAPPDRTGLHQAARCAALLGEAGRDKPLLKEVYLQTAHEERTTAQCVEKNIRALIHDLYQADPAALCQALALPAGRPANRLFLLSLARAAEPVEL